MSDMSVYYKVGSCSNLGSEPAEEGRPAEEEGAAEEGRLAEEEGAAEEGRPAEEEGAAALQLDGDGRKEEAAAATDPAYDSGEETDEYVAGAGVPTGVPLPPTVPAEEDTAVQNISSRLAGLAVLDTLNEVIEHVIKAAPPMSSFRPSSTSDDGEEIEYDRFEGTDDELEQLREIGAAATGAGGRPLTPPGLPPPPGQRSVDQPVGATEAERRRRRGWRGEKATRRRRRGKIVAAACAMNKGGQECVFGGGGAVSGWGEEHRQGKGQTRRGQAHGRTEQQRK